MSGEPNESKVVAVELDEYLKGDDSGAPTEGLIEGNEGENGDGGATKNAEVRGCTAVGYWCA